MYTFDQLLDAQMKVRKMLLESGLSEDVVNDIFIKNLREGCNQISTFNQGNNVYYSSPEKERSSTD